MIGDLNALVPLSVDALRKAFGVDETSVIEVLPREGIRVSKRPPTGPTESTASAKRRHGQEYFRDAVLNNFGGRCGLDGACVAIFRKGQLSGCQGRDFGDSSVILIGNGSKLPSGIDTVPSGGGPDCGIPRGPSLPVVSPIDS